MCIAHCFGAAASFQWGFWKFADLLWNTVKQVCPQKPWKFSPRKIFLQYDSMQTHAHKHTTHTITDWCHLPTHECTHSTHALIWCQNDHYGFPPSMGTLLATTMHSQLSMLAAVLKEPLFYFWGLTIWVSSRCSGAWELLLSACMNHVLDYSDYGFSSSKPKHTIKTTFIIIKDCILHLLKVVINVYVHSHLQK